MRYLLASTLGLSLTCAAHAETSSFKHIRNCTLAGGAAGGTIALWSMGPCQAADYDERQLGGWSAYCKGFAPMMVTFGGMLVGAFKGIYDEMTKEEAEVKEFDEIAAEYYEAD